MTKNYRMLHLCIKYVNESNDKTFHPALLVEAARLNKSFQILVENNANFDVQFKQSTPLIETLLQFGDGSYAAAQYLLEQGVNVTYKSFQSGDALYISIKRKYLEITKKIVEMGGDVNTVIHKGYTALGLAVFMIYMEAVQYLVSKGANINATDYSNRTVLQVASELTLDYEIQINLIKYLISLGADPNYYNTKCSPMLCKASKNEDIQFISWLLNNGADPNLIIPNRGPIIFECLQYFLSEINKIEFVTLLLNHGVPINVLNFQDENLLFPCIENIQIVDYLIRQGIDINYVNINSCSALHEALNLKHYVSNSHNQIKIVLKLLHNGADITISDGLGTIPLHMAASNKHCSDIARLLVQKGSRVNARDSEGNSVLHYTCQGELAMWLYEKGANINAKNDHGVSVLHSVIKGLPKKEENVIQNIVTLLANCTINKESRELISSQYLASIDWSRYMKYLEFVVNNVQNVEEKDDNGMTAMHYAVFRNNTCPLHILVKKGINILNKTQNGDTVLHSSAFAGNLNVVTYVLENLKHDILLRGNNADETPLHMAAMLNHVNIVKVLLIHGVEVNHKNDKNMTALHLACKNGNLEIVKILLSHGANLYETCSNWFTAIHLTVQYCKFDVFKYLLEFESQNPSLEDNVKLLELKTDSDETLLHVAAKFGRLHNIPTKIIQYLINNLMYDIDTIDKLGNSALHYACCTYVSDAVELLVDNGANINLKNKTGNTPLHFAAKTGRLDIIDYLMLQGGNGKVKNKKGNSPVHMAIAYKNTVIIPHLADKPLDLLYVKNRKGNSAVHIASVVDKEIYIDIGDFYVSNKDLNYNVMNHKHQSPLSFAAKYASSRSLLRSVTKENINVKDVHGNTPFHRFLTTNFTMDIDSYIACGTGMCSKGADLLVKNKFGETSMHVAIRYSDPRIVPYLLPYVIDVNVTDDAGQNILHAALYNMDLEVIKQIFTTADLNAKTNDGETYLHIVLDNPNLDVLEWLVPQCTSIINEKDFNDGYTQW